MRGIFKQKRSERGAITVFVLCAMLIVLMMVFLTYMNLSNKKNEQEKSLQKIEEEYQAGRSETEENMAMEEKYQQILAQE